MTWQRVDRVLRVGGLGLSPGSSLARLLKERIGVNNRTGLHLMTEEQILAWADAHFERHGEWPTPHSGSIPEAPGQATWAIVNFALRNGHQGLPRVSSLTGLLARHRQVRYRFNHPEITPDEVLSWADAYFERHGEWPSSTSGPIPESPGDTWQRINDALRIGYRGLSPGSSLALLLQERRGVRNQANLSRLTEEQILAWADAHFERHGAWPGRHSGAIVGSDGETWHAVNASLVRGHRGLPGGTTLAELLARRRGRPYVKYPSRLRPAEIIGWAGRHHARHGTWPTAEAGPIPERPGETWAAIDTALRDGKRGLSGGSSLARFLEERI